MKKTPRAPMHPVAKSTLTVSHFARFPPPTNANHRAGSAVVACVQTIIIAPSRGLTTPQAWKFAAPCCSARLAKIDRGYAFQYTAAANRSNMPFHCVVVTPEQQTLSEPVNQAILPAFDGLIGILPGRRP